MNIPEELPGSAASRSEEECNSNDVTIDMVADIDYRKYTLWGEICAVA